MPAPPAICCRVQDAEVLELLAANGWDPIHNRQLGEGPRQGVQLPPNQVAVSELFVVDGVPAGGCQALQSVDLRRLVHSHKLLVERAHLAAAHH